MTGRCALGEALDRLPGALLGGSGRSRAPARRSGSACTILPPMPSIARFIGSLVSRIQPISPHQIVFCSGSALVRGARRRRRRRSRGAGTRASRRARTPGRPSILRRYQRNFAQPKRQQAAVHVREAAVDVGQRERGAQHLAVALGDPGPVLVEDRLQVLRVVARPRSRSAARSPSCAPRRRCRPRGSAPSSASKSRLRMCRTVTPCSPVDLLGRRVDHRVEAALVLDLVEPQLPHVEVHRLVEARIPRAARGSRGGASPGGSAACARGPRPAGRTRRWS